MTGNQLCLLIGNDVAGTVTRRTTGRLAFDYDPDYAESGWATPLSVSMPLQVRSHADAKISPWMWGLVPDNDAVLSRWSREFHVAATPFSLLATPLGEDCPGAVRLVPESRLSPATGRGGDAEIEWLTEADVAQRLRHLRRDQTAWLGTKGEGRFSLAGAQAKTALIRDGDRWGDAHGATATSHILKPAIEGFDDHDLNGHLCLSAMRAAGMSAVRTSVERFEGESAIVIARYDRALLDHQQIRLHQEDLCQALGVYPSLKYQNEGGPGPRDIAALFRRVMPRSTARAAAVSFLEALVWNWIIAGTDAHAKNYSLLLLENQVRLAPFYDVASSLPYDWPEQKAKLAMKFGGGCRINPGSSPWGHLASDLRLPEDEVRDRSQRLVDLASEAFMAAAADPAVRDLGSMLPDRLAKLVAERSKKCAKYL